MPKIIRGFHNKILNQCKAPAQIIRLNGWPWRVLDSEIMVRAILEKGIALQQTGDHAAAEKIFRQVLERDPEHPDALHMLGLTLHGQEGSLKPHLLLIKQSPCYLIKQCSIHMQALWLPLWELRPRSRTLPKWQYNAIRTMRMRTIILACYSILSGCTIRRSKY
ncbi:MAG: tetratricopeptide repeat protein [Alphaproteobacteria bacterium]